MRHRMLKAAALLALMVVPATARAENLTYADLVERMTDPEFLATLPAEGERNAMASSYNRESRYDEQTGRYVNWGANQDGHMTASSTSGKDEAMVLADLKGPGVIWRIWSARAEKGNVRIFIDGAEKPVIDVPFSKYFDGSTAPFNRAALVYTAARGQNSYVPIPYNKSCKIVADAGWGRYYQVTYTTLPAGTTVPSFTTELKPEDAAALDKANEILSAKLGTDPKGERQGQKTDVHELTIPAGKSVELPSLTGPRAITGLRAKVEGTIHRADEIAALREVTLAIRWDGEKEPAVWSPLGDFFSTAMGASEYKSLLTGYTPEQGFYSYWYMPFRSANVQLTNDSKVERKVRVEVTHAPLTKPAEQLGRFHAKWHRDAFEPKGGERWPDWTVLTTQGRGRFCGFMLHVWSATSGPNPQFGRAGAHWWGEGDEKFFVDGEKFPSTFGTGTEDYFGYAWCDPTPFEQAYHGQTTTQNNKGHQSVFRHQVADNVPFQKSFDGYLEKYYPNHWPTRYAATSYFYLAPGGTDPYKPVADAQERTSYYEMTDAYEGERMKVVSATGGTTERQTLGNKAQGNGIWSGLEQLWWKDAKKGDKLTLSVPVVYDGTYRVRAGMTQAADYGMAQLEFAGQRVLAPIDFFYAPPARAAQQSPGAAPVEIDMGTYELKRGQVPFVVEITGANDKAKGTYVGVDYVKLEPVE